MVQHMRLTLRSPKHYFASKKTVSLVSVLVSTNSAGVLQILQNLQMQYQFDFNPKIDSALYLGLLSVLSINGRILKMSNLNDTFHLMLF